MRDDSALTLFAQRLFGLTPCLRRRKCASWGTKSVLEAPCVLLRQRCSKSDWLKVFIQVYRVRDVILLVGREEFNDLVESIPAPPTSCVA